LTHYDAGRFRVSSSYIDSVLLSDIPRDKWAHLKLPALIDGVMKSVSVHEVSPDPPDSIPVIPPNFSTPVMICKQSGRPLVALRVWLASPDQFKLSARDACAVGGLGSSTTSGTPAGIGLPQRLPCIWVPFLVDSVSPATVVSKLTLQALGVVSSSVPQPWIDNPAFKPPIVVPPRELDREGPFRLWIEGDSAEVQVAIINDPFDRFGGMGSGETYLNILGADLLRQRSATFVFHPWDTSRSEAKSTIVWYDR